MRISLKLLESDKDISNAILDGIINYIKPKIPNIVNSIRNRLPSIITLFITSEPEYQSLKSGKLRYEFGIPDVSVVDNIVNFWANNFTITSQPITKKNNQIYYSLSIGMIKENFNDVLSLSDSVVYDGVSGINLPWLQWLLLDGGKIIVKNYEVKMGPNPRSRTGMAVMIESKKNWRVPPEFAGTSTNNWVIRAVNNINNEIIDVIRQETENSL